MIFGCEGTRKCGGLNMFVNCGLKHVCFSWFVRGVAVRVLTISGRLKCFCQFSWFVRGVAVRVLAISGRLKCFRPVFVNTCAQFKHI